MPCDVCAARKDHSRQTLDFKPHRRHIRWMMRPRRYPANPSYALSRRIRPANIIPCRHAVEARAADRSDLRLCTRTRSTPGANDPASGCAAIGVQWVRKAWLQAADSNPPRRPPQQPTPSMRPPPLGAEPIGPGGTPPSARDAGCRESPPRRHDLGACAVCLPDQARRDLLTVSAPFRRAAQTSSHRPSRLRLP